MVDRRKNQNAEWILEQIALINPYNRQGENRKSEFYIYQAGFLAGYLASLAEEDPWHFRRFERHINAKKTIDKSQR